MGLFSDLFDFNGDGKVTLDEEYLAIKIFEECSRQKENDVRGGFDNRFNAGIFNNADASDKYEWRLYCEDGFEFGIDPEDFETEEEYEEALNEAKYGWRDDCESVLNTGVDPEDFETEEEYEEALNEAKYGWRDDCESVLNTGVDPEDFETEEEYEEALNEAKYGWRDDCESVLNTGVDPEDFETEEEYEEALNEAKYGWRDDCESVLNTGVDPEDFETQDEYRKALNDKIKENRQREWEKRLKEQQLAEQAKMQEYEKDKTIYTYCGVLLPFSTRPYSFRTEDKSIKIGDTVIVPVGEDKKEISGKVVSVGQYSRLGVPYPVERTKMIIRKSKEEKENGQTQNAHTKQS